MCKKIDIFITGVLIAGNHIADAFACHTKPSASSDDIFIFLVIHFAKIIVISVYFVAIAYQNICRHIDTHCQCFGSDKYPNISFTEFGFDIFSHYNRKSCIMIGYRILLDIFCNFVIMTLFHIGIHHRRKIIRLFITFQNTGIAYFFCNTRTKPFAVAEYDNLFVVFFGNFIGNDLKQSVVGVFSFNNLVIELKFSFFCYFLSHVIAFISCFIGMERIKINKSFFNFYRSVFIQDNFCPFFAEPFPDFFGITFGSGQCQNGKSFYFVLAFISEIGHGAKLFNGKFQFWSTFLIIQHMQFVYYQKTESFAWKFFIILRNKRIKFLIYHDGNIIIILHDIDIVVLIVRGGIIYFFVTENFLHTMVFFGGKCLQRHKINDFLFAVYLICHIDFGCKCFTCGSSSLNDHIFAGIPEILIRKYLFLHLCKILDGSLVFYFHQKIFQAVDILTDTIFCQTAKVLIKCAFTHILIPSCFNKFC